MFVILHSSNPNMESKGHQANESTCFGASVNGVQLFPENSKIFQKLELYRNMKRLSPLASLCILTTGCTSGYQLNSHAASYRFTKRSNILCKKNCKKKYKKIPFKMACLVSFRAKTENYLTCFLKDFYSWSQKTNINALYWSQ